MAAQYRPEIKRKLSIFRPRSHKHLLPRDESRDGRHRPQDPARHPGGRQPVAGRDRRARRPLVDPLLEAHPEAGKTGRDPEARGASRSEEHTSELQSLMRISYAVFCLQKKNKIMTTTAIRN